VVRFQHFFFHTRINVSQIQSNKASRVIGMIEYGKKATN
jgi:hypothetical protein